MITAPENGNSNNKTGEEHLQEKIELIRKISLFSAEASEISENIRRLNEDAEAVLFNIITKGKISPAERDLLRTIAKMMKAQSKRIKELIPMGQQIEEALPCIPGYENTAETGAS